MTIDPTPGSGEQPEEEFDFGHVRLHLRGLSGRVVLARSEKRNAINASVAEGFLRAVEVIADRGVLATILAAEGPTFCAGADLGPAIPGTDPNPWRKVIEAVRSTPTLWIAEVQGGAIGAGVALALSCPVVIAAEEAWFWMPEIAHVRRFPVPITELIAPLIGMRAAFDLAVRGERVTAAVAHERGWITDSCPAANLVKTGDEWAQRVLKASPETVGSAARLWSARLIEDQPFGDSDTTRRRS